VTDRTRNRINAAFDDAFSTTPVPPGLRALSIRDAVTAPRRRSVQPQLLIVVATIVVLAVVVTLVIGSHVLRNSPVPAKPTGSASLTPPSSRSEASLVYDGAHSELVLFGGSPITGGVVNETWTWDGKSWTLHHLSAAPTPRAETAMAFDQLHGDVVLFGGAAARSWDNDTWIWDGSAWKQQHPHSAPDFNFQFGPAAMQFDPVSKSVLLYGFHETSTGNQSVMNAETWSWNGSDWKQLSPANSPTQLGVMVGGDPNLYLIAPASERVGGRYFTEIWRWEGTTWTLLPASDDIPTNVSAAAFDPQLGRIVAPDGWTWDGSSWKREHLNAQPPAVGYMAYFPPRHQIVSFGSQYGNTNNDLWGFTGTTWVLIAAGTLAPPTPGGQLGPTTPDAAEAFIRKTMTATKPALFPKWLPPGMEATVTATTDTFNLDLTSDQRDKQIFLGTVAAQPPPGDSKSSDTYVEFRHAVALKYKSPGYAEYFVYDSSAPQSDRWLMWIEPGTMSVQGSTSPGVWYFLSASGLTDQEFWQVANSLG
jgi:hypothetical protein